MGDSESEDDGQLHSPGYELLSGGEDLDLDLNIKPPQASSRASSKKKSSTKDKKHSKEHKHKDRDRVKNRDRGEYRMVRTDNREKEFFDDRRYQYQQQQQQGGRGNFNREREKHHRREQYHQQQQYSQHREEEYEYYNRHNDQRETDKRQHRNVVEYRDKDSRRPHTEQNENYENNLDAERALEDLRCRLLSKRSKYERELARYDEGSHQSKSKSSHSEHKKEHRKKDNVIDLIDSPEQYREKKKEKKAVIAAAIIPEDPELAARRAKLLEAEREMARRKELAREELEARRELRKERGEPSLSPKATKKKRHHKSGNAMEEEDDEEEHRISKKKRKKAKFERKIEEEQIIHVSDQSDKSSLEDGEHGEEEDEEDVEEDSESDSDDSISLSSEHSSRKHRSDEDLPGSPLSIDELSKPERRRRFESRSRSVSVASRSPSHSDRSKSYHRSSLSRSRSRSKSKSRSRSRSGSHSRSESGSKSQSRSRSRSKSRSASKEKISERETEDIKMTVDEQEIPNMENSEENNKNEIQITADSSTVVEEGDKLPNYFPGIQGCRSVEEFQCLNRIEEGTYGVVYRAKVKRTNEIVALKRLKMEKEKEGFPITSLREINTLLKGQHPNIVTVREIVVGSNMDKIFIVMDYVEHDLKSLMETMRQKKQKFFPGEVKCLIQQLLRAVGHLHDNWILHRDLKTSNLLLSHKGILKVGDFGLAREYGSPLKAYTSLVVTLWYRAPELLLCAKEYSTPIDMWSVGCIFGEFLQMEALFPGKSEIDQLNRIFKELGTPNEKIWTGYKDLPAVQSLLSQNSHFTEYPVSNLKRRFAEKSTELGHNLLQGLLTYDPKQRLTAEQALKNPYFKELPLPIDPSMFPTWPAKSELGVRRVAPSSPKPPSGGSQFKQLGRDEIPPSNPATSTGFVLNAEKRSLAMGPGFNLKF